jgi:aerobic carbon-monoxide dehydrogenase large subunit
MSRASIHNTWSGRIEDDALLRGHGRFGDDARPEGAAAAAFVRSPHAHARIRAIDVAAAKAAPGVLAAITGADLAGENYATLSQAVPLPGRDGKMAVSPHRPVLASERVLHVGEPVALIIAETPAAAQDAAERVAVDYEPLAAVTDASAALAPGAPQLWPQAPGNVAFDWAAPADADGRNAAEIERIFAAAPHRARVELINQRLVAASLEPRVATASYDPASAMFTLRAGTQGVASIRNQLAQTMRIKPEELRVLTEDVGGGFGMKASTYPEYVALLYAVRQVGRPVHWAATRAEAFVSDNQGRSSVWTVELALDERGRFLALRVDGVANVGAYMTLVAHFCATLHISGCLPAVYDIPRASVRSRCVFTNTVPVGPYRGAGRPEANYLLERVIDEAARVTGIDAAKLRRCNLISAKRMPYATPFGNSYDSGDFPAIFEQALGQADYAGFAARRRASRKAGRRRGIGIACYLEIAGAFPEEAASVAFPGGGRVAVGIGASPQGQGHLTVFRRVAAEQLGIPESDVTVLHGDSARDVPGFGAVASRSAMMIGGAIVRAIEAMLEKGRRVAALLLQASEAEIEYGGGTFRVANSGRGVTLFAAAERAVELKRQGVIAEDLDTQGQLKAPPSFPNGCHVAEVEIDEATGAVEIVRYSAVDDCGRVLDPVIVEAQIHGGVAQGIGQALAEHAVYDSQSGQMLTGSFMDYAMPRAADLPAFTVAHHAVPCRTNPLGVKGTGEAGTTAAPPAVLNAIANALPGVAASRLQMPATAETVWRALQVG